MLFDQILESALLKVLLHIVFKLKDDSCSSSDCFTFIRDNSESTSGIGLPSVLLIVIVLGNDSDFLSNKVGGVETYTELTNHANVSTSSDGFHEGFGSGLSDGSKIVDEIVLSHTNTRVMDGQSVVGSVWDDLNLEVWLSLKLFWFNNTLVADFIEGIRGVRDKLPKEDLFVRVESVDDKGHQLLDVSIECKYFFAHGFELGSVFEIDLFG